MIKTVKTTSTWKEAMRVDNQAGTHTVTIDQPEEMGGTDAGANPMEFFLFALGGCQANMAAIIARQEGIDLKAFSMELEGDYDLDVLMGRTEVGRAGFSEIREKVFIQADLTDEEKQAFFEKIHTRCPVTESIRNKTHITFEIE